MPVGLNRSLVGTVPWLGKWRDFPFLFVVDHDFVVEGGTGVVLWGGVGMGTGVGGGGLSFSLLISS